MNLEEKKKRSPGRKSRQEQIREITDRLEKGVKEVFESEKYREMLRCMSKFHHYSLLLSLRATGPGRKNCKWENKNVQKVENKNVQF